jgi:hypothetical protein
MHAEGRGHLLLGLPAVEAEREDVAFIRRQLIDLLLNAPPLLAGDQLLVGIVVRGKNVEAALSGGFDPASQVQADAMDIGGEQAVTA